MKKLLLCLSMLMMCMTGMTAFADNAVPFVYGGQCGKCGGLTLRETIPDQHVDYYLSTCSHGKSGQDLYLVYGDLYIDRCQTCGHKDLDYGNIYLVFGECQGY